MSDLWTDFGKRSRATLLDDFNQKAEFSFSGAYFLGDKPPGQAEALNRIEGAVDAIVRSGKPACLFKGKAGEKVVPTNIGKILLATLPLAWYFGTGHSYSEKPGVFLRAFIQANCQHRVTMAKTTKNVPVVNIELAEIMNTIVESIRKLSREPWYRRVVFDRQYEAGLKARTISEYVRKVLQYRARTLAVRVDFGYVGGASANVTIDRVYGDREDFVRLMDYHPLFEHMTGYAWSIEQGDRKGFHIHVIFFFDGSAVFRDVWIGKAIGELWEKLTLGAGMYYNCNAFKNKYDRLGIGMIHRDNSEECENVVYCAQYLPKGGPFADREDRHLRIRPRNARAFGAGQAPDLFSKRPCRAPKVASVSAGRHEL